MREGTELSRTKKTLIVMVWVIFIGLLATPYLYIQINKKLYDIRVTNYLIDKIGYTAEEIQSVEGVYGIKLPTFYAKVVFKDEPYVEYIYFAHNGIRQFEYRFTVEGEQKGITEVELKHLESK